MCWYLNTDQLFFKLKPANLHIFLTKITNNIHCIFPTANQGSDRYLSSNCMEYNIKSNNPWIHRFFEIVLEILDATTLYAESSVNAIRYITTRSPMDGNHLVLNLNAIHFPRTCPWVKWFKCVGKMYSLNAKSHGNMRLTFYDFLKFVGLLYELLSLMHHYLLRVNAIITTTSVGLSSFSSKNITIRALI